MTSTPLPTGRLDDATLYALTRSPQGIAGRASDASRRATGLLAVAAVAVWAYDLALVVLA